MGDGGKYRDPRAKCAVLVRLSVSVSASVSLSLSLCRPSDPDVEVELDPTSQPGAGSTESPCCTTQQVLRPMGSDC